MRGPPCREAREILEHVRLIGAEIVGTVFVNEHAVVVVFVVSVAAEVTAALDHKAQKRRGHWTAALRG